MLSIEEIRNMKNLEKAYLKSQNTFRDQLRDSQAFVRPPPGQNWENIDQVEILDQESPERTTLPGAIELDLNHDSTTPQTPRQSAFVSLQQDIGQNEVEASMLENKLN